jgi:DNA-binding NtrC family response regulator
VARILIVVTDAGRRTRIEDALRASGHDVETCAALDSVADPDAFDAAVVEVDSPSEERMDPARLMRERHPGLPIVPLVARPTIRAASRALRAGALDVLIGAETPEGLRAAVAAALAHREADRSRERSREP